MTKLLEIEDLVVQYRGTEEPTVKKVSLELQPGQRMALVGESGSGKSTLVKALLGLSPVTGGEVRWQGTPKIAKGLKLTDKTYRRQVQMIFQDPYNSLHPRMTVRQNLYEPLRIHGVFEQSTSSKQAAEMLERVGLDPGVADRFPHEFSGGQLQRIGIARALLPEPKVLLADEPVSALDVSVQAQVLNLLGELSSELGVSVLMISHDLAVVHQLCERVAVMFHGRLVEIGEVEQVCFQTQHPYTETLVKATLGQPVPAPKKGSSSGQGCPYQGRCHRREERCEKEFPPLVENTDSHASACFFPGQFQGGT